MKDLFNVCVWLFITLIGVNYFSLAQQTIAEGQKKSPENQIPQKTNEFLTRLRDPRLANPLVSAMWTLTHDYSDSKRMNEVMKTFQEYVKAFEKKETGDYTTLERLGGVKAFKDKLAGWLNDDDQSIRAFSATLLGISGDKSYAPKLADLLKVRRYKERDLIHYDKGRAAMALGMLEAKEYTQTLVNLLKSRNEFDRAGAALGLGYLKAKKHAPAVRKLLKDKDENTRQIAKEVLKMMGASEIN